MTIRRFPLIADGQPVTTAFAQMALYDDEDLISNIHGVYQEKNYHDSLSSSAPDLSNPVRARQEMLHRHALDEGKSYAERAREQARRDVKMKRQTYLAGDVKPSSKGSIHQFHDVSQASKPLPTPKVREKRSGEWAELGENLRQKDYILAELPKVYKEPDNQSTTKPKKNNYDFLKTSQIYNPTANHKERAVARELNLSRFEQ